MFILIAIEKYLTYFSQNRCLATQYFTKNKSIFHVIKSDNICGMSYHCGPFEFECGPE